MLVLKDQLIIPQGFYASGIHCGIKNYKKDVGLIYSEIKGNAAGVFTQNTVKAAPVLWNMKISDEFDAFKAIVVNSGNANACTGEQGQKDNEEMAETVAQKLGCVKEEVFVASTGVIGVPLPMDKVIKGIRKASDMSHATNEGFESFAEAIMTTDKYTKKITVQFEHNDVTVTVAGVAKGSGMIHPNMGTMLSFILTDANVEKSILKDVLSDSTGKTYNMISVDGDTSTNDMAILFANGAVNVKVEENTDLYQKFYQAVNKVNEYLAKQIVKDGEGATKLIECQVFNVLGVYKAQKIAKSIINSNLVKTAFFGCDANWGRIICAAGYAGTDFNPNIASLSLKTATKSIELFANGVPLKFDEDLALEILQDKEITIELNCNEGKDKATAWGCDLTYDYVKINGEYRT